MDRSLRVKRGFRRVAIAGAVLGVIGAIAADVIALRIHMSELSLASSKGQLLFPSSMKDEEISKAMVAFVGAPTPEVEGKLPYYLDIAWARAARDREVEDQKQIGYAFLVAAVVWAAFWLGLSWIVRGFMT